MTALSSALAAARAELAAAKGTALDTAPVAAELPPAPVFRIRDSYQQEPDTAEVADDSDNDGDQNGTGTGPKAPLLTS